MTYQDFVKFFIVKETEITVHGKNYILFLGEYKVSYEMKLASVCSDASIHIKEKIIKDLYWHIWGKEKRDLLLKVHQLEEELGRIFPDSLDWMKVTEAFIQSGIDSELLK